VFGGIHVWINKQHLSQAWCRTLPERPPEGRRHKQAREREALAVAAAAHAAALDRLDWQLARLRRELETAARFTDEGAAIIAELAAMAGGAGACAILPCAHFSGCARCPAFCNA